MWETPRAARVGLALVAGLALMAVALVVTLSGSPLVLARANATPAEGPIAETHAAAGACQDGELLPAGTSAIRLTLQSDSGPRVALTALSGARVLTSGVAGRGWTSGAVTVPVRPHPHAASGVRICFALGSSGEDVQIIGSASGRAAAAVANDGRVLPGRVTIEYLRPARSSWWSLARTIARRMGLGRAAAGSWIALLVLALTGSLIAAASWLTFRELR